jgi:hypothetical protein
MYSNITFGKGIKAALQGGLVSAGINILWYVILVNTVGISNLPKGFVMAIVISSILPLILGSFVYVLLLRNFLKGKLLYYILASAFAVFSIFPSFQTVLPDGSVAPANFALLTVPMHFIVAVVGSYFFIKRT